MCSYAVAAAQIARFKRYPTFPENEGSQSVLIRALREASFDDEHAVKIGDHLIRTLHFAPVAADIYDAVAALAEMAEGKIPEWHGLGYRCETCQDTRWKITPKGAMRCPDCTSSNVHKMPRRVQ